MMDDIMVACIDSIAGLRISTNSFKDVDTKDETPAALGVERPQRPVRMSPILLVNLQALFSCEAIGFHELFIGPLFFPVNESLMQQQSKDKQIHCSCAWALSLYLEALFFRIFLHPHVW
jgi:hypothetical protein